jgi:hypothetical protein
MTKYIIKDWTGKVCVTNETFKSYDDAFDALSSFVNESIKDEIENYAEYLYNQEISEYHVTEVKE